MANTYETNFWTGKQTQVAVAAVVLAQSGEQLDDIALANHARVMVPAIVGAAYRRQNVALRALFCETYRGAAA